MPSFIHPAPTFDICLSNGITDLRVQLHRITVPPPDIASEPTPATTVAFDTQQELLWVGNEYGRITSFYGSELRRYTSFWAHPSQPRGDGEVKQLLFHDRGVVSVAATSVHLSSRRGLTQWHNATKAMRDLSCMSYMGKGNAFFVVAGCQNVMLKIDIERGRIVEEIPTEHEYTMMKYSHYICAATITGSVDILDPDTFRIIKTLETPNSRICDMDARNNYLVTCGWVTRQQGTPMLASLANVYDLRSMVQLPPIPFAAGAAHVQMHPRMSTTCIIASHHGQLQVVDLMNSNTVNLRQANISNGFMSGLVLAPSGEAFALSDTSGFIHLWGSPTKVAFAEISNPIEFADPQETYPVIAVDDDVPLSTIGMPYYREQLLSAWTSTQLYEVGNPPAKIDPLILSDLRPSDIGSCARNPKKVRRNQAIKTRLVEVEDPSLAAPKFLSEKARESENNQSPERRISDIQEAMINAALNGSTKADVPIMYRNVEIKYTEIIGLIGLARYYNKTQFSGLETHIANSYSNSLLQLLKFTPLVRNVALHHTATTCLYDTCLLCEMGFLFDMMEKAEGQSCQATNFLKTFSSIPEASNMGLLEENSHHTPLTAMLQAACRFLLEHSALNYRKVSPNTPEFNQTLAIEAPLSMRCVQCHNETIREGRTYINDLVYPPINAVTRTRNQIPTFSQVLKISIERATQTRGWCDKCRRYQQLATRKSVRSVPDVLMINAAVSTAESKQYWAKPGWMPSEIGVIIENGKCFCFEGEDLRLHVERGMHNVKVYELVGIVADINSGEHQKSHLVSLINTSISDRCSGLRDNWHLFNDFLVRKVSKTDALHFAPSWKMPAILAFQVVNGRHAVDDSWKDALDPTLLYIEYSINNRPPQDCQLLNPATEAPVAGSYVAIDTEFVALQQEEIEIKADGDREIVRPTRLGLARVSVLRGSGVDEGLPFINDYITITEPIVDYLTKWSGVHEGDLNTLRSSHNLVPLKVAYKKLWLLLNLGCIFIGHGLPKDFRTINIHVPKAQVLDTVDLFYIRARQRKLSLRFLAWYLLKEDIQQETHDSIEDARTALRLWRKFEEFRDAGVVDAMVEEVYREGKKWGYKPPGEAIGTAMIGRREKTRSTEASLGVPGFDGGRETPEILRGGSGPGTPVGKPRGVEQRVGAVTGEWESPAK
ncbi:poly(A)-specific ribonuclease [Xylographa soralifera]|nr:poly(A)-specific ribonuclease [Xylographa soralifera]